MTFSDLLHEELKKKKIFSYVNQAEINSCVPVVERKAGRILEEKRESAKKGRIEEGWNERKGGREREEDREK